MPKPYWNIYRTQEKAPWQKVGVAFLNKDGSYNMRLRGALTATDKLQMRQPRQKQKAKEQGAEAGVA
jgi:hypothetical protein